MASCWWEGVETQRVRWLDTQKENVVKQTGGGWKNREINVRKNTAGTLFLLLVFYKWLQFFNTFCRREDHPPDYIISFNIIKAQISIIKSSLVAGQTSLLQLQEVSTRWHPVTVDNTIWNMVMKMGESFNLNWPIKVPVVKCEHCLLSC